MERYNEAPTLPSPAAGSVNRRKNMNKDICVRCDKGVVNIRVGAIIIKDRVEKKAVDILEQE